MLKQIKGLDTIRAFAIIFVLLWHWGVPFDEKLPVGAFIKRYIIPDGALGVDIFFVLSGFLITSILLDIKVSNKTGNRLHSIKSFFARRALRIFPIYYLTMFFLLLINYQGVREHAGYYLTFTSNILIYKTNSWGLIPHTWSLAVEEQFYLFWPWLILFINRKYLKYIFILAILTGIISGYIIYNVLNKGAFPILLYNTLVCFGFGSGYAYSRLMGTTYRKLEKWLLPAFIIAVTVHFCWKIAPDSAITQRTFFLFRTIDSIIGLQLIAMAVNSKPGWAQQYIWESRALNFIGSISYGIYLYHNILQPIYDGYIGRYCIRHPNAPWVFYNYPLNYFVKLLLLLLISWGSYKLIEQPILNLKKHFKYQR